MDKKILMTTHPELFIEILQIGGEFENRGFSTKNFKTIKDVEEANEIDIQLNEHADKWYKDELRKELRTEHKIAPIIEF